VTDAGSSGGITPTSVTNPAGTLMNPAWTSTLVAAGDSLHQTGRLQRDVDTVGDVPAVASADGDGPGAGCWLQAATRRAAAAAIRRIRKSNV
jgi:hypothetical protein